MMATAGMSIFQRRYGQHELTASQQATARSQLVQNHVIQVAQNHLQPEIQRQWSLLAVGGFGRGELFPHSDVDLLFLVSDEEVAIQSKNEIGLFLQTLWDEGLSPSHSVHTVEECCRLDANNIELTISLLTNRFLTGNRELADKLREKLPAFILKQRRVVTENLLAKASARRVKFQDTIYHLEPDIKEAPGGFRDLHLIEWLGLLRGAPHHEALRSLRDAKEFLSTIRIALHERSKRDDNRLTFDAQDEIFENPADAMRVYYFHAREIDHQVRAIMVTAEDSGNGMLRQFFDWRSRLSNAEFTVSRGKILLRNPQVLSVDPQLLIRLLQFIARHGILPAYDTERRMTEAVRADSFELPGLELWREIRDLLSLPHAAKALRTMHDTGLMKKLIPEWGRIECLVTRDFYHRYTVDEHTLVAIENLEKLANSQGFFRELLSETSDLYLLRLALLLHDIGKGDGTGEHAEASTRIAREVLARLAVSPSERDTILYLIEHHLDLFTLMTTRDLQDAAVIEDAAGQIGTIERLQLLTLMTFVDMGAVNPTALTPWRMGQLWNAYRSLHHEFTRELEVKRIGTNSSETPERKAFLDGFPTRYLLVHTPEEVDVHFEMSQQLPREGIAVHLMNQKDSWVITVIAKDRVRLFADLTGTLASFGMNILKAEAFSNHQGLVLDTIRFSDPMHRLELNPVEVEDLSQLVKKVVAGKENIQSRLAARPKVVAPSRNSQISPMVRFSDTASDRATLLEVVAQDRAGLLFDLAQVISESGCNIEVILVNTEAHKAFDVFYLTASGDKLTPSHQDSLSHQLQRVLNS